MVEYYNPDDKQSVINYAKRLLNNNLRTMCSLDSAPIIGGKGSFGQILEKYYFGYDLNSNSEADFKSINLELKSSPIKKLKNGSYGAKERLVLNIINYIEIVSQDFDNSDFWKKNQNLLLIFYLHELEKHPIDYVIKIVDEWSFPKIDLYIIKKDWELIQNKIREGKAHELSEGDTFYLGACTKGSSANTLRAQPESEQLAKQRAFSLKQGYVNHIIASLTSTQQVKYGKIITDIPSIYRYSLEEIVTNKFAIYYEKDIDEIIEIGGFNLNTKAKNFYANLTKSILNISTDQEIEEFEKANITVKTVRLAGNGLPKEDLSLPSFRYTDIISEIWSDSKLLAMLDNKFLFIFFQFKGDKLILKKIKFWSMPYADKLVVKQVWEKTQSLIQQGKIISKIEKNKRYTYFPNKKFNPIAHVRPHANTIKDTFPLPIPDEKTGLKEYTKHSFWLNSQYVRDFIYEDI